MPASNVSSSVATCLIGLGSNLGDRAATLNHALAALDRAADVRVLRHSRWLETSPAGGPVGQGDYLNGAAVLETTLSPHELLRVAQLVETQLGRTRDVRWGPRTLDVDLLLYGEQIVDTQELTIPHPRMTFRHFVLDPAAEIAGDWRHPQLGLTLAELRDQLDQMDRSTIQ